MCALRCVWSWPQAFTRMLLVIPLTVVDSRKEVDDIKELITICKEYHIAMRCELKRKVRSPVRCVVQWCSAVHFAGR